MLKTFTVKELRDELDRLNMIRDEFYDEYMFLAHKANKTEEEQEESKVLQGELSEMTSEIKKVKEELEKRGQ